MAQNEIPRIKVLTAYTKFSQNRSSYSQRSESGADILKATEQILFPTFLNLESRKRGL
jgi:hypothetical protein